MSAAFLDLPFVWSELMSRLTGTDSEHDAEVVRSFSEAFDIPERHVMSRIRTHLHRSLMLQQMADEPNVASVVRIAGPQDYDEVWRLLMASHAENGIFPLDEDKVRWFVNRIIYPETISLNDTGTRGVAGVIGPVQALEGIVLIVIGTFWYSGAKHLEEMTLFVDPNHRRSGHAVALLNWMKAQVQATGLPLMTGILSNHRTEAKCRLYQRQMPKLGEFYFVTPEGLSPPSSAINQMAKPPPPKDVKRLWAAMCDLVADEGGWVTSVPNNADIRMEARIGSDLPEMLEGLGYTLASAGNVERLLPSGTGIMPAVVQSWTFTMPQLVAEKPDRRRPKVISPAS